jgi:uncharacterized protein
MLLVKTYLDKSPIAGIGLFAAEDIAKDTKIWIFQEGFDRVLTRAQFDTLPEPAQKYIVFHAFLEKEDFIVLTADNDEHTNHSDTPNTYIDGNGDICAAKDILKGEEITADYRLFDGWTDEKLSRKFCHE